MKAKDAMIPLSECPRVAEDRSLQSAIILLTAFRQRATNLEFLPRFVLVQDDQYKVVGVLRHLEILRALAKAADPGVVSLDKLVAAAPAVAAKDAMTRYGDKERIGADAPIEEAIERMIAGPFRHLLVEEGNTVVGILRMSEVFSKVRDKVGKATLR